MLRLILKSVRTKSVFKMHYLRCSTSLMDKNAEKKINLDNGHLNKQLKLAGDLNELKLEMIITNMMLCECISDLAGFIKAIEPHLIDLESDDQLEIVILKIYYLIQNNIARFRKDQVKEVLNIPEFSSLLDHVNRRITKLDNKVILSLIYLFSICDQDPKSEIVANTFNTINDRLNAKEIDLNLLAEIATKMSHYILKDAIRYELYFVFQQTYLKICKDALFNNEIDFNKNALVMNYFTIFLNPLNDPSQEAINFLIKKMLSDYKFNFEKSIKILRKIHLINENYNNRFQLNEIQDHNSRSMLSEIDLRFQKKRFLPASLDSLIDKLNLTIYLQFQAKQSGEDINFYLRVMHKHTNYINSESSKLNKFYDFRLFGFLVNHLIKHYEFYLQNDESCKCILFVLKNYQKSKILNERFLKFVYYLYCENSVFRLAIRPFACNFFIILARYRLPFVDYSKLTELVFSEDNLKSSDFHGLSIDPILLLGEFILHNVINERLYDYLFIEIENLFLSNYDELDSYKRYCEIALAKIYLSLFGGEDMNVNLKSNINQTIEKIMKNLYLAKKYPIMSFHYNDNIDNRLQRNGYFTNGLFIEEFVIYDKRIQNLISLEKYRYFFTKIDRIPINEDQQL